MDENKDITLESQPEQGDEGAVETQAQPDAASTEQSSGNDAVLQRINKELGKDFKDLDTALKSWKDTSSFVGKKKEDFEKELSEKGYLRPADLENALFFRDNPDHAENKDILEAIASKNSISLSEAAKHESYTKLYESAKGYKESQSLKSVVNSNPRIKAAQEKTAEVAQAMKTGSRDNAQEIAARAVAEAYDIPMDL